MILDRFGNPIETRHPELAEDLATAVAVSGETVDILPDPDPVLRTRGDDARVLKDLAADDQVTMAMQLRKRKVTNKTGYDYKPGQPFAGDSPGREAARLCDDLTLDLTNVKLRNVFNVVLSAPFWGYSVFELYWKPHGSRLRLTDVREKPREWFGFDGEGRLFMYQNGNKTAVPFGKFLVVQHEPTYENPYGLRLLSRCLWPVAFKKAGTQWAVKFLEKYGMPWTLAKAPQGYDERARQTLAGGLAAMVQDAVAVLPSGAEVEVVQTKSSGVDGHLNFLNFWNGAISKVLSCQTQASEITGSGTYASSKTHYDVLTDVAEADEALVCDAMNELAGIYAILNGSTEYPPVFSFTEAKDYMAQADLDKKRYEVGVRFKKSHFERQGLAADEFELVNADQTKDDDKTADHARKMEHSFPPEQQSLEYLADSGIAATKKEIDSIAGDLLACAEKAKNFDELTELLEEAFPEAGLGEMEDLLAQAMTAADMFGRFRVLEENGEEA